MSKNSEIIEDFKKSLSATIKSIGKKEDIEINFVKENPSIIGNTINLTEPKIENFKNNFKVYNFHNLYKELLNFCTVELSAFYFDIRKDTLYCDQINSKKRKSCVTILNILLKSLLRWFAPILSFTTEEIYQLISKNSKSIHLEKFLISGLSAGGVKG